MSLTLASQPKPGPLRASAERAAEAALRELPEALVLVFDGELRLVQAGGLALGRLGEAGCAPGRPLADVLAGEVWRAIEPLLRSALDGETRTRELWTADRHHCLLVDVGPLEAGEKPAAGEHPAAADHAEAGEHPAAADHSAAANHPAAADHAEVGEQPRAGEPSAAGDMQAPAGAQGIAVVLEITARRQSELLESLGELEPEHGERGAIGTGVLDCDGRWLLVNRGLCETTGYTAEELLGKRFDGIVHPDDVANDMEQRRRLLAGELQAFSVEKRYFDASGETVAAIVSMALVREPGGAPLHYVLQLQDVSERRMLEEELRALGDHDPLTGVRNRRLFAHDLKLQVARSRRYGEAAGLMIVEVDPFAGLPAHTAERVGDEALEAVSRALMRRLRETDLIARLGADQFGVLLPHIDEEGLAVVAESLDRVISACGVEVGEELLHPSASIGHALVDERTESAEQALARVERSLRMARRAHVADLG